MDVLVRFYREYPLLVKIAAIVFACSILINLVLWRTQHKLVERFQDIAVASEQEIQKDISNLPPEIRQPETPPMYQQENCATIKKTIDAMKLTEMSKKENTKELAKSQLFQAQKRTMEEHFVTLGCKEYLEKIAMGEIPAPKTPPDMRPDILPSQV